LANTITLKRRIGSVKNTRQITKAMELVAASKMRRATESAHRGRAYREAAHSLLSRLTTVTDINEHPLYTTRAIKRRLYVVITSDRGLAGAYNANVIKLLTRSLRTDESENIKSSAIVVGKRGAQFVRRIEKLDLIAAYSDFGDHPGANDIRPILNTVVEQYRDKHVDDVQLIYTIHKSNILQEAQSIALLPARFEQTDATPAEQLTNTTFEPSINEVLDNVTERLLEVQIWQAMLESIASEHSMRMLAMKNATDNAGELIGDLTLEYNTARQAKITQELAEITGGAEAMK
jgi:F-type H+-transporting ATPase subunit gamma